MRPASARPAGPSRSIARSPAIQAPSSFAASSTPSGRRAEVPGVAETIPGMPQAIASSIPSALVSASDGSRKQSAELSSAVTSSCHPSTRTFVCRAARRRIAVSSRPAPASTRSQPSSAPASQASSSRSRRFWRRSNRPAYTARLRAPGASLTIGACGRNRRRSTPATIVVMRLAGRPSEISSVLASTVSATNDEARRSSRSTILRSGERRKRAALPSGPTSQVVTRNRRPGPAASAATVPSGWSPAASTIDQRRRSNSAASTPVPADTIVLRPASSGLRSRSHENRDGATTTRTPSERSSRRDPRAGDHVSTVTRWRPPRSWASSTTRRCRPPRSDRHAATIRIPGARSRSLERSSLGVARHDV